MTWLTGLVVICLGWVGVNFVKITLLAWLLRYISSAVPIPILKSQLLQFKSKIIWFVWGNKGHRCRNCMLFRMRTQGCLGLSKLCKYSQVTQLAQISIVCAHGNRPDWVSMERQAVPRHAIDFLLWGPAKSTSLILAPTLSYSMALFDTLYPPPGPRRQGLWLVVK